MSGTTVIIWLIAVSFLVALLFVRTIFRAIQDAHHAKELNKLLEQAKQLSATRNSTTKEAQND